jgi:hypothetical protein
MNTIDIANNIFEELGSPTGCQVSFINSWLINNIGDLNVKLGTDLSFTGLVTGLNTEQAVIHKLLFNHYYYGRQAQMNLGANGYSIMQIREGDSSVRVVTKTELAKEYTALQKQTASEIEKSLKLYRLNVALPSSAATSGDWSAVTLI